MLKVSTHIFVTQEATRASIERALQDRRLAKIAPRMLTGGFQEARTLYASETSPALIIIETGELDNLSEQVEALSEHCEPGTNLILLGNTNDIGLYRALRRQGVADYLPLPLAPDRLVEAVAELFASPDKQQRGQLITFMGSKGGCGVSTLTTNTAYSLTKLVDRDVLVVDLDLPFGSADLGFNIETSTGIRNALAEPDRVDDVFLQRFAVKYDEHLHLLAASPHLEAPSIDADRLETVFNALRQHVDYVLVDLPHVWNGWVQRTLRLSDTIVLVSPLDLAAVRNTQHLMDWLAQERPDAPAPHVVLNGTGSRGTAMIEPQDLTDRLGIKNALSVPYDLDAFRTAMSAGKVLEEVAPKSKSTVAVRALAERLSAKAGSPQQSGLSALLPSLMKSLRGR